MHTMSNFVRKSSLALLAASVVLCGSAYAGDWSDSHAQALLWSAPAGDASDSSVINQPSMARDARADSIVGRNQSFEQALRFAAPVGDEGSVAVVEQAGNGGIASSLVREQALRLARPVTDGGSSEVADISVTGYPIG